MTACLWYNICKEGLFQMKNILILLFCLCLLFCGCGAEEQTPNTPNTNPPTIMVEGVLYVSTGKMLPAEVDESAILGTVESVVSGSGFPTEDGQANFPCEDAKYARISDGTHEGVVVMVENEWIYFEEKTE